MRKSFLFIFALILLVVSSFNSESAITPLTDSPLYSSGISEDYTTPVSYGVQNRAATATGVTSCPNNPNNLPICRFEPEGCNVAEVGPEECGTRCYDNANGNLCTPQPNVCYYNSNCYPAEVCQPSTTGISLEGSDAYNFLYTMYSKRLGFSNPSASRNSFADPTKKYPLSLYSCCFSRAGDLSTNSYKLSCNYSYTSYSDYPTSDDDWQIHTSVSCISEESITCYNTDFYILEKIEVPYYKCKNDINNEIKEFQDVNRQPPITIGVDFCILNNDNFYKNDTSTVTFKQKVYSSIPACSFTNVYKSAAGIENYPTSIPEEYNWLDDITNTLKCVYTDDNLQTSRITYYAIDIDHTSEILDCYTEDYGEKTNATAKKDETNTLRNYGPCKINCTTKSHSCLAYQTYKEDDMCYSYLDKNDGTHGELYLYPSEYVRYSRPCVNNSFKDDRVQPICENHYSLDYCKNTLNGKIGDLCSDSYYNPQEFNDLKVFSCTCTEEYKTLSEWKDHYNNDNISIVKNAVPCMADRNPNDHSDESYYKYKKTDLSGVADETCEDLAQEKRNQGYQVFYDTPEYKCEDISNCNNNVCSYVNDEDACLRGGQMRQKSFYKTVCNYDINNTQYLYYGYEYARTDLNYCSKHSNGIEIKSGAGYSNNNIKTYTNNKNEQISIISAPCRCSEAYYEDKNFWKNIYTNNKGQSNFEDDAVVDDKKSKYGFCVYNPFTNVPLDKNWPDIVEDDNALDYNTDTASPDKNLENIVRPSEKLYRYDAYKCKDSFYATSEDYCQKNISNLSIGTHLINFFKSNVPTASALNICSQIYIPDTTSFCDIENVLSTYAKDTQGLSVSVDPVKYDKFILSCEKTSDLFEKAGVTLDIKDSKDTSQSNIKYISCYTNDGTEKYITSCHDSYSYCNSDQQITGNENKQTCELYGEILYEQCRPADCAQPSENTIILKNTENDSTIKTTYGPDVEIVTCSKDGVEKKQVTCNAETHDDKCDYPYTPNYRYNWCRIADSGNLNSTSPKRYMKTDTYPACFIKFSNCRTQIASGIDRISLPAGTALTVTKTAEECYTNHGTAAIAEACKEASTSKLLYNCYYDNNAYIYTTSNCSIGNDLTLPYILKNGTKYWNRCDCAEPYKYYVGNCADILSGDTCTQTIDAVFRTNRGFPASMTIGSTITFYTQCNKKDNQNSSSAGQSTEVWANCRFCCPRGTKASGKTKVENGSTLYECK